MEDFRILLVDDEVDFVETLSERLSLRKYNVRTVNSAAQAMPLLYSFKPHLVILDIRMPEMNGIEFLKLVKKAQSFNRGYNAHSLWEHEFC